MSCEPCKDLIEALLSHHGKGAGAKTKAGDTPLHLACAGRQPAYHVVQMLLAECHKAAAMKDERGKRPLQLCVDNSPDGTANLENMAYGVP